MKKYNLSVSSLKDEAMRKQRDELVVKEYRERVQREPQLARSVICERMAAENGLNSRTIQAILKAYGEKTALPNYAACGRPVQS